ncbi:MAG: translation elongation factor 4 [Candidatus Omnitrophica bacterium]|nr:translation elongation factor 4 [Candidatus Omnitrophota bacterium]
MTKKIDKSKIRNFSIIAHIDHGKSSIADRFLLATKVITQREFRDQMLDDMDLERERGITIKARAVRIPYGGHWLNLIDTPGHVDFNYEVSKSLAACEGVILLVDGSQGVEAQTVSNYYLAKARDMVMIPVVTKIDLPATDLNRVEEQIKSVLKLDTSHILLSSAKTGEGVEDILDRIIAVIPPPEGDENKPLKALIFDSKFDVYRGVIVYIRVFDGVCKPHDVITMMAAGKSYEVEELGVFNPYMHKVSSLGVGEVGYVIANIKEVADVKIGDTVTLANRPAALPCERYKEVQPMVFCGMYPINAKDFDVLRDALSKLQLNDSSFLFEPESSKSLGFGFRCGFLGLLHMEIVQERLEREFDLNLIITAPNVVYRVVKTDASVLFIDNPTKLPPPNEREAVEEPYIKANVLVPVGSIGDIMKLCQDRRGEYISTEYLDTERVMLVYELPLSEIVMDFYDKIKSMTSGYGSFNYEFIGYKKSKLVRMDILINGDVVDALSTIVFKESAYYRGRTLVTKMKEVIPRQLFEVVVQAAIGSKIIARDSIKALRKDVTSKCYGGDITRKRKLWEKQKEGKKRMKKVGKVDLPQEAFITVLRID